MFSSQLHWEPNLPKLKYTRKQNFPIWATWQDFQIGVFTPKRILKSRVCENENQVSTYWLPLYALVTPGIVQGTEGGWEFLDEGYYESAYAGQLSVRHRPGPAAEGEPQLRERLHYIALWSSLEEWFLIIDWWWGPSTVWMVPPLGRWS